MSTIIPETLDLSDYLEDRHEGEHVRPASYFRDQVKHFFHGGGNTEGALLPWAKTHETIRLRAGEVSLWHGENYSGKTTLTSHVAVHLIASGWKVLVISLEMPPRTTLGKMNRQTIGVHQPSIEGVDTFHDWTDGKLWVYDRRGSVQWDKIIAVIRYAQDKFGIQHVFVDNLMKCVRGEDDYNGQKDFVNALCTVAQDTNIHAHLIHHTKKPAHGAGVPGRYDAKGSGSISDQVDNAFGVWRNRNDNKAMAEPDCVVNCDKQRHGEWDGKFSLWFDQASQRYSEGQTFQRSSYIRQLRAA
ncbi:AAA family ATPase [Aquidulcibacter sp.]|uniref:AAA family ATPase n=1 Tax=Aquidulcibacter sp. TaxID=2052990 RepID=UPI0025B8B069|nr:AAA family ATPase [Aquidulcibacter sp.]MCA3064720.1 AAA family ATPase [Rhodocyclaceae bacterium]MCA3694275.1 AAA family ATPase [Aquidulcibacter sp.]